LKADISETKEGLVTWINKGLARSRVDYITNEVSEVIKQDISIKELETLRSGGKNSEM